MILQPEPGFPGLRRVEPVAAVFALLSHCGLFRSHGLAAVLSPLSQLVERLPLYQLARGPLPEMQDSLVRLGTVAV